MPTTTERVGRYQLLEPIGAGPCGTVSRAKVFGVAGFERQFAIKRFHPELTITTALAQALSAAARAYGSLEHPRIARMSEFGVAQGTTFTAVEYVAGLDAARLIAEAKLAGLTLAAGGALALVSQAARAVGYAHGRGLTHLGLAPTNVITTLEGDVKITDFGVLAAGLPQRPIDVARLQQRIQYLAPEQIANEATSAATDVFALGVLAYELVTGQRTFKGDTPQQIAQSIMHGPPAEPPLPRPIVRVLQRCLARSPFERFPDARALADALDAALRVAPVPGTRKDIGAQVKTLMERLAALNESEMSGMVALHVGTGPVAKVAAASAAPASRESVLDLPTHEFVRPDVPVPGPAPLVGPATTLPEMPKPMTTITGLAPPPIAVPQGIATAPSSPPPAAATAPATLLGIPKVPATIPSIKAPKTTEPGAGPAPAGIPRTPAQRNTPPPLPVVKPPVDAPRPHTDSSRPETEPARSGTVPSRVQTDPVADLAILDEIELDAPTFRKDTTKPGLAPAPPRTSPPSEPPPPRSAASSAPPPLVPDVGDSTRGTREMAPVVQEALIAEVSLEIPHEDPPPETPTPVATALPSVGNAPGRAETEGVLIKPPSQAVATEGDKKPKRPEMRSSRTGVFAALLVVGLGAAGVAAWQIYERMNADAGDDGSATTVAAGGTTKPATGGTKKPATKPDAGVATAGDAGAARATTDASQVATAADASAGTAADAATAPGDAAQVATAPSDAVAAPADAAQVAKPDPTPGASGDSLTITSTPSGARVYVDGADTGTTPLKLPGSPDRHTIALLLPGHELYIAQVDGSGAFQIPLKEVTPSGGPAGIKVIKCKDKDRYYVFVDGKPTGMMCPTERIETDLGPHTVEVYDAVTESRKKYEIEVKDTRLSHRVKIE